MILAVNLRPSDCGTHVVIGTLVSGRLEQVSHVGVIGMTELTIDGTSYAVWPDTLVQLEEAHELARLAQPGGLADMLRAGREAEMHALLGDLARGAGS